MQPTELVTLNMRELDRLKVIQAVVDRPFPVALPHVRDQQVLVNKTSLLLAPCSFSQRTSKIPSTSTVAPAGSVATPTAVRAWRPGSPNTANIRSEAPLMTLGTSG